MTGTELKARLLGEAGKVIIGKDEVIEQLLVAILAGGHVLLEDVPGTGKTKLARTFAGCLDASFSRIQFTPDLLPSDVTGLSVFDRKTSEFVLKKGPVFTNILLADEINRATPRTQAGLLEAMEELQVTIDGNTLPLPEPFLVIATENPIENMGTFPLPEAQLDRFLMKLSMGYPEEEEEQTILSNFAARDLFETITAVLSTEDILEARKECRQVRVSEEIRAYIVSIGRATRESNLIRMGVSTRGLLALQRCAMCLAYLSGRDYVIPDDVITLTGPVLSHRVIPSAFAHKAPARELIGRIVQELTVPTEGFE
ncbi:MAG: MoxR family ATPase [Lachnospiraceae bacterium]|nr:MoxR family ATPase [Lachnospiraceae bacterium]